jgi:uncharacterized membrane protein
MLGVPGLDPFGLFHAILGLVALLLGLAILLQRKGTLRHRQLGYAYVGTMLLLNGSALAIYDLNGRFGPFHVGAVISLASVAAGLIPVMLRVPSRNWLRVHAETITWSYVGLVAAFLSEIAVRLPGSNVALGAMVGTAIAMAGGAVLIRRYVPRVVCQVRTVRRESPPPALER